MDTIESISGFLNCYHLLLATVSLALLAIVLRESVGYREKPGRIVMILLCLAPVALVPAPCMWFTSKPKSLNSLIVHSRKTREALAYMPALLTLLFDFLLVFFGLYYPDSIV